MSMIRCAFLSNKYEDIILFQVVCSRLYTDSGPQCTVGISELLIIHFILSHRHSFNHLME